VLSTHYKNLTTAFIRSGMKDPVRYFVLNRVREQLVDRTW